MGFKTEEEARGNKPRWVRIHQDSGNFQCNDILMPVFEGRFLGFSSHEYKTEKFGMQHKFDVFLEDEGKVYQFQFTKHTWVTFMLLNQFLNIVDQINGKTILELHARKEDDGNYNVYFLMNGKGVKRKITWEDTKLGTLSGEAKNERRNKLIDAWAAKLIETKPYIPDEPADDEQAYTVDDDIPKDDLSDDIPF